MGGGRVSLRRPLQYRRLRVSLALMTALETDDAASAMVLLTARTPMPTPTFMESVMVTLRLTPLPSDEPVIEPPNLIYVAVINNAFAVLQAVLQSPLRAAYAPAPLEVLGALAYHPYMAEWFLREGFLEGTSKVVLKHVMEHASAMETASTIPFLMEFVRRGYASYEDMMKRALRNPYLTPLLGWLIQEAPPGPSLVRVLQRFVIDVAKLKQYGDVSYLLRFERVAKSLRKSVTTEGHQLFTPEGRAPGRLVTWALDSPWGLLRAVLSILQQWKEEGARGPSETRRILAVPMGSDQFARLAVDAEGVGVISALMKDAAFRAKVPPDLVDYAASRGRYDVVEVLLSYPHIRDLVGRERYAILKEAVQGEEVQGEEVQGEEVQGEDPDPAPERT